MLGMHSWNEHDEVVPASAPASIMGQWAAIGCHLLSRCILNFAESPETRARDTKEIEPTIVLFGARFWESQAAGLRARMADLDAFKRLLFRLLKPSKKPSFLADLILVRHVRRALGLSRARICYSTGGILSPDAVGLYHALGIPVEDLYATTEGGICVPGCEARIEDGEIVYRGPGAFVGYYKGETPTDGWVRTSDAGIMEKRLRTIDRQKRESHKDDLRRDPCPSSDRGLVKVQPLYQGRLGL